jgi:hypothetical protein
MNPAPAGFSFCGQPVGSGVAAPADKQKPRAGRSRESVMLVAARNLHLFIWSPRTGASSTGFTLRLRRGGGWTHYRLVLLQRNRATGHSRRRHTARAGQRFAARPTLTLVELARWRTAPGTSERVGLKSYLRVKAGAGGRQL